MLRLYKDYFVGEILRDNVRKEEGELRKQTRLLAQKNLDRNRTARHQSYTSMKYAVSECAYFQSYCD
jgi:hypothetical protein